MKAVDAPSLVPSEWAALSRCVAGRVGTIILLWQAIDVQVNETIMAVRTRRFSRLQEPYAYELQRRFEDRLDEWLDLTLPALGRSSERESLRSKIMALKSFRDMIAHGIVGMNFEDADTWVVATEQRHQRTRQSDAGISPDNKGLMSLILQYSAYSESDFTEVETEMIEIISVVRDVCVARLEAPEV